jgi:hypothetical protein
MLKVVMAGFARYLGFEVESLYFWFYGHAIKPDEMSVMYAISIVFPDVANHSLYSSTPTTFADDARIILS